MYEMREKYCTANFLHNAMYREFYTNEKSL